MGIQLVSGCAITGRSAPILERECQVKAAWQQGLFDNDCACIVGAHIGRRRVGVLAGPFPSRFCRDVHHWCDFLFCVEVKKARGTGWGVELWLGSTAKIIYAGNRNRFRDARDVRRVNCRLLYVLSPRPVAGRPRKSPAVPQPGSGVSNIKDISSTMDRICSTHYNLIVLCCNSSSIDRVVKSALARDLSSDRPI